MLGRLLCGLHHILCCPDPCYEPCYIPAANAGFFLDSAKPVTQSKFRFDASIGGTTPDRAEYLWAQIGGRGPANPEASLVHYDLVMENEFATERFSFFVSTPFRIVVPTNNPTHAGYADMRLGTKSLLVDSELLLVAFQFSTILPTGVAPWGTGNGHVSLEPSLLMTLKVCEETYLQTQIAEWIPLGGTPGFQGPVFHYHFSLNHTLTAPRRDMKLIGTMEFGSYVFHSGGATLANGAVVNASDEVYYHLGPGFRFHFCNKIDIGFGMQFGVSDNMFFDQLYRTELRWRF